jgi:hypothetical protein
VRPHPCGLTLLECLILLVVMSIVTVAAGVGIQSVAKVPTQADDRLIISSKLVDCLEQLRAEPWATMSSKAASLSVTPVTVGNKTYSCTVTVASADPDGSGTQADFRILTATIGTRSMSVYATQP